MWKQFGYQLSSVCVVLLFFVDSVLPCVLRWFGDDGKTNLLSGHLFEF